MLFTGPSRVPIVSGHRRLEFNLTEPQSRVYQSKARHRMLVTGRRFGKTTLDITELVSSAAMYPGSENWYVAPTFDQAEELVWEPLVEALDGTGMVRKFYKGSRIELRNNSLVVLKSGAAYDRMRGKGIGRPVKLVVFDEMRHIPIPAWKQVVRPLLADRKIMDTYGSPGRALFTGTPGGFDDFKKLYDAAALKADWEAFQFTSIQGGNITKDEIEQMRQDLSERDFRQELEARFEALSGLCYHAFANAISPLGNVDAEIADDKDLSLYVGMDFNVDPMTATISQKRTIDNRTECWTFDEIVIRNSDTDEMSGELKRRYPGRKIIIFPDPHSATKRGTNAKAGATDFKILRTHGFQVYMPSSRQYLVRDRLNTVNGLMRNTNGQRRLKVHPRCKHLLECFNGLTYKEGTSEPDKSLGIEHIGDAEGYMIMGAFPAGVYNSSIKELRL